MIKPILLFNFLIIFTCITVSGQVINDKPIFYKYKYSIEKLKESFSKKMMLNAKKDMAALQDVIRNGKYKGTLQSLDSHKTPEWYKDAKLGIFFDWGLYSIAGYGEKGWSRARYPDWYLSKMYNSLHDYHIENWGKDFHRDDFIPLFTAANFNAKDIIDLVKSSGAKYFVPFNKHHDGYCLWDSKYTHRDAMDMMPGRDLTAELVNSSAVAGFEPV